jgi:hypothetical protein
MQQQQHEAAAVTFKYCSTVLGAYHHSSSTVVLQVLLAREGRPPTNLPQVPRVVGQLGLEPSSALLLLCPSP